MGRERTPKGSQNAVILDESDESSEVEIRRKTLTICSWSDCHGVENVSAIVLS